ncbi:hypothetical protein FocnCong_v021183 [Fusarium oxysporum f. sp. conglutinans]|nr:hypothetical protein FocnCong_v021183 [Fusarium oxysporum f. sp. conglutinans]
MDFENDRDRQPEHAPARKPGYEFAEIGELYESHVWGGEYRGTLPNLTAINPYPELPGVWTLTFQDANLYRQMVYEFEDFVVVLDCPPHQSHLVIQWVKEKLKKPLKYVWVGIIASKYTDKRNVDLYSRLTIIMTMLWEFATTFKLELKS